MWSEDFVKKPTVDLNLQPFCSGVSEGREKLSSDTRRGEETMSIYQVCFFLTQITSGKKLYKCMCVCVCVSYPFRAVEDSWTAWWSRTTRRSLNIQDRRAERAQSEKILFFSLTESQKLLTSPRLTCSPPESPFSPFDPITPARP